MYYAYSNIVQNKHINFSILHKKLSTYPFYSFVYIAQQLSQVTKSTPKQQNNLSQSHFPPNNLPRTRNPTNKTSTNLDFQTFKHNKMFFYCPVGSKHTKIVRLFYVCQLIKLYMQFIVLFQCVRVGMHIVCTFFANYPTTHTHHVTLYNPHK